MRQARPRLSTAGGRVNHPIRSLAVRIVAANSFSNSGNHLDSNLAKWRGKATPGFPLGGISGIFGRPQLLNGNKGSSSFQEDASTEVQATSRSPISHYPHPRTAHAIFGSVELVGVPMSFAKDAEIYGRERTCRLCLQGPDGRCSHLQSPAGRAPPDRGLLLRRRCLRTRIRRGAYGLCRGDFSSDHCRDQTLATSPTPLVMPTYRNSFGRIPPANSNRRAVAAMLLVKTAQGVLRRS